MNPRYCLDCGAQCDADVTTCAECGFPMRLEVISEEDQIRLTKPQVENWKRVSQVLKRNGLIIHSTTGSGWSGHAAWWALPALGAMIFLVTLVFGGTLSDMIWKPPMAVRPVLDLNAGGGTTGDGSAEPGVDREEGSANDGTGYDEGEEGDEYVGETSMAEVQSLSDALRTTQEQYDSSNDNIDLDEYVDKPEVSHATIEKFASQAMIDISVKNTKQKGTLLSRDGLFLVSSQLLDLAYKREVRTVPDGRSFREKVVTVIPTAGLAGKSQGQASSVFTSEETGVTLLRIAGNFPLDYSVDFDSPIEVATIVWLTREVNGKFYPEKVRVIDVIDYDKENRIKYWVLESDFGSRNAGTPVFDTYGQLVGIFLPFQGHDTVLPLLTIRERAPLIFKAVN